MHAVGLHSALAIKRQRKRRDEQKRARERRFSSQSTESGLGESRSSCASPRASTGSLDHRKYSRRGYRRPRATESDKVVSSVGMLHIGVVFLVLGLFLFASGLIPDDLDNWTKDYKWFNELFISGAAIMLLGIFFIILNKIITKKEEDDLTEYVQKQLTRSRSGHRLIRDVETGCLTTKSESKHSNHFDQEKATIVESQMNGGIAPVHFSQPPLKSPPPLSVSTPRSDLERILEEELSAKSEEDRLDRFARENVINTSYSPSPEGRELITARYYDNLEFYEK